MKKVAIILACMLVCFTLFSGCTDKEDNSGWGTNAGNSEEIDDMDMVDMDVNLDPGAKLGTEALPDGFTYTVKDPDSADGIVVTPRE